MAVVLVLRLLRQSLLKVVAVAEVVVGFVVYSKPMTFQPRLLSAFMLAERLARKVRQAQRAALEVSAAIRPSARTLRPMAAAVVLVGQSRRLLLVAGAVVVRAVQVLQVLHQPVRAASRLQRPTVSQVRALLERLPWRPRTTLRMAAVAELARPILLLLHPRADHRYVAVAQVVLVEATLQPRRLSLVAKAESQGHGLLAAVAQLVRMVHPQRQVAQVAQPTPPRAALAAGVAARRSRLRPMAATAVTAVQVAVVAAAVAWA